MIINPAVLAEIVDRVVTTAHPEKVVLFGSAARGEMSAGSDFDFLVVAPNGTHRRRLAQKIYQNMIGVGHPVDVVVVTPEDIDNFGSAVGLIIASALAEGRVVYERTATSA
jgi:predicted nucleotidyltransferase